ncbi:Alkaline phosphatase [Candidatus Rhodobacter oscarellae]|uniref:Alkaline phosphatase n=1 Tax=Candidatus Rhodobacter oscarellae TaxID=1675527 RepID=A0A0J9EAM0_9RHOB|nr:calcium-binding protein [Candidatus Rhodobacter lobularis]KMW59840.1 Alkaline phosphatase [Candidatus Rhodobacter lobularis]
MVDFTFKGVLSNGPANFLNGITDLDIRVSNGQAMLFTANGPSGGLLCYQLSGGSATLLDQAAFAAGKTLASPTALEEITLNGGQALIALGHHSNAPVRFDLNAAGQITGTGQFQAQGGFDSALVALETISLGGDTFVYTGEWGQSGPVAYRIDGNGVLQKIQSSASAAPLQGADLIALEAVKTGGNDYLVTLSAQGNSITSYEVASNGMLTEVSTLGAAEGLGIDAPTAMVRTTLDGAEYLIVSAANTGSLSVLEIGPDGSLTNTDHILGDLSMRLGGVTALEVVTIEGRSFVVAGGGEGGLNLFTLLPGGRLLHLDGYADTGSTALANVQAIALHATASGLEVFASSQSEAGITHMSIGTGNIAAMTQGTGSGDTLNGTAADDLLDGGAGNDSLNGGAGNDILIDGAGRDTLTGGAGADIFVFTDIGSNETITDFELGVDRIDLSAIGYIRNLSQIQITSTATGARLEYGGKTITIVADDGQPIDPALFAIEDLVDMSHFVFNPTTPNSPTSGDDVLTGTAGDDIIDALAGNDELMGLMGNDFLQGGAGNDTLHGDADDDTLMGGAGADDLRGGAGVDTAFYVDSTAPVGISLNGDSNWGWATGDTFFQIENLIGGNFNDTLVGSAGDNMLDGWDGDDQVFAGNGHDLVLGGGGNDFLNGDNENDTVIGGDGNDTLTGGRGDDVLEGQNGDDILWGWLGLDTMIGGPGNDMLFGEEDSDYIDGWSDDDSIFGGSGWDTLIGGGGNDLINGDDQDDTLLGGDGFDTLAGGRGNDYAHGEDGDDLLFGWLGQDLLEGGNGNDTLNGEEDNDTVSGGAGNDLVIGGTGDDFLVGWLDHDTLDGGAGNDLMNGEAGNDVFIFFDGHGDDTILGFEANNDLEDINLSGITTITGFSDLHANHMSQQGADVVIDTGTGSIRLVGVSMADLDGADFIF